jgi:hypothetical protein
MNASIDPYTQPQHKLAKQDIGPEWWKKGPNGPAPRTMEIANSAGYTIDLSLSRNRTRTINIGLNCAAQEEKKHQNR